MTIGDRVYITADVIDDHGNPMQPDTTGKGTIVGLVGSQAALVQWGSKGDYRYATINLGSLRAYDTRPADGRSLNEIRAGYEVLPATLSGRKRR